jgi:ATP-dependent RNA helicase SUPV3L1/SUV3
VASPSEAPVTEQSAAQATPEPTSAEAQPPEEPGTAAVAPASTEEAAPAAVVQAELESAPAEGAPLEPATAVDADATPAETAAAAEHEPQFEEIWRPRRHQRREGPRRDGDRDARHSRGRSRHQRGTPAGAPPVEGSTPTPVAAEANDSDRRSGKRFDRRGSEGRSSEQTSRKDEGNRFRRDHEKRNNRSGDNRHEGRRRDEPRRSPQVMTAAPPKSSGGDSSPFAALAALKAQMEKRSEGSGST